MEDFKTILKVLEKQNQFYLRKNNDDWSEDKNEGFKLGLKYCSDLIDKMVATMERSIN
jgi:hypothetical protein